MRRWLLLALAVLAVGALGWWAQRASRGPGVGPLQTGASREHPQGDCCVFALQQEPTHLNPLTTSDLVAQACVLKYTHDTLLGLDADSDQPVARLASRWESAGDGRTFTLELREAVFADGAPLQMQDVLLPWELARAGHALPGSLWEALAQVESMEAVGPRHLRVVLRERHFAGLARLGCAYRVVQRRYFTTEVARHAAAAGEPAPDGPADPRFARHLLKIELPGPGTGPYQLARDPKTGAPLWRRGSELLLSRNELSWHRAAEPGSWNLAGMRLRFEPDPAARLVALRRQAIDFVEDRDAEATLAADPELAGHYRAVTYAYRTLGPWFVVWNHDREGLGDARVRRALTMLLDRERIAAMLAPRAIAPASWFRPDTGLAPRQGPLPFDVEGARALLAEAGYGPGRPLSLRVIIDQSSRDHHNILDLVTPAFRRAGVDLEKVGMAFAVFQERLRQRDFDGFLYLYNPDAWNDPYAVFHSSQAVPGRDNWMHYRSARADAVLERARVELDEQRRRALYTEFCDIFREDQPVSLLYHQRLVVLLHRRFRGVQADALGLSPKGWWVEPAAQLYRTVMTAGR